jgi:hypothetical protein
VNITPRVKAHPREIITILLLQIEFFSDHHVSRDVITKPYHQCLRVHKIRSVFEFGGVGVFVPTEEAVGAFPGEADVFVFVDGEVALEGEGVDAVVHVLFLWDAHGGGDGDFLEVGDFEGVCFRWMCVCVCVCVCVHE